MLFIPNAWLPPYNTKAKGQNYEIFFMSNAYEHTIIMGSNESEYTRVLKFRLGFTLRRYSGSIDFRGKRKSPAASTPPLPSTDLPVTNPEEKQHFVAIVQTGDEKLIGSTL